MALHTPDNVTADLSDLGLSAKIARSPCPIPTGTRAQNLAYTGEAGVVTYDTDEAAMRIHDGSTPGGQLLTSKVFGARGVRATSQTAITTAEDFEMTSVTWQNKFSGLKFWLGADFVFVDGDVTVADNTITEVGHGMITGDGPFPMTSSGTLPAGLALATDYWCIRVDDDTFKVALSFALAAAGTAVNITAAASGGNHTVARQHRLVVPHGITHVRIDAGMGWDTSTAQRSATINKKGTGPTSGAPFMILSDADTGTSAVAVRADESGSFTDITTDGDYYEMSLAAGASLALLAGRGYFGITALGY